MPPFGWFAILATAFSTSATLWMGKINWVNCQLHCARLRRLGELGWREGHDLIAQVQGCRRDSKEHEGTASRRQSYRALISRNIGSVVTSPPVARRADSCPHVIRQTVQPGGRDATGSSVPTHWDSWAAASANMKAITNGLSAEFDVRMKVIAFGPPRRQLDRPPQIANRNDYRGDQVH